MSNFKSGSGNLDFGGGDQDEEEGEKTVEGSKTPDEGSEDAESTSDHVSTGGSSVSNPPTEEYPYFVRRNNVGDERDTRLEIHVRDKVADRETQFRNELAEHLGANEVSKTDAREFALLAAFHHPERVAELMEDEGFGALG